MKVEVAILGSPSLIVRHGLCGRKATLNSNPLHTINALTSIQHPLADWSHQQQTALCLRPPQQSWPGHRRLLIQPSGTASKCSTRMNLSLSLNGLVKKGHRPTSVVVMNTVKQLQINIKSHTGTAFVQTKQY